MKEKNVDNISYHLSYLFYYQPNMEYDIIYWLKQGISYFIRMTKKFIYIYIYIYIRIVQIIIKKFIYFTIVI